MIKISSTSRRFVDEWVTTNRRAKRTRRDILTQDMHRKETFHFCFGVLFVVLLWLLSGFTTQDLHGKETFHFCFVVLFVVLLWLLSGFTTHDLHGKETFHFCFVVLFVVLLSLLLRFWSKDFETSNDGFAETVSYRLFVPCQPEKHVPTAWLGRKSCMKSEHFSYCVHKLDSHVTRDVSCRVERQKQGFHVGHVMICFVEGKNRINVKQNQTKPNVAFRLVMQQLSCICLLVKMCVHWSSDPSRE